MSCKHLLFAIAFCTAIACDPLDGYDDHECYCGVVLDKYEIIGMSVNGADNMQYIEAVNDLKHARPGIKKATPAGAALSLLSKKRLVLR